jgi:hypothetical protein
MNQSMGYLQQPMGHPQPLVYLQQPMAHPQPMGYLQQPMGHPQPLVYLQQPMAHPQPMGYPQQLMGHPQPMGYPQQLMGHPQPMGYPQQPMSHPHSMGYLQQSIGHPPSIVVYLPPPTMPPGQQIGSSFVNRTASAMNPLLTRLNQQLNSSSAANNVPTSSSSMRTSKPQPPTPIEVIGREGNYEYPKILPSYSATKTPIQFEWSYGKDAQNKEKCTGVKMSYRENGKAYEQQYAWVANEKRYFKIGLKKRINPETAQQRGDRMQTVRAQQQSSQPSVPFQSPPIAEQQSEERMYQAYPPEFYGLTPNP